ncbi:DUF378 domain-containing protein [Rhizobacter sp. OV335]|uniref:DUF378 domain-containing protein n=1 Tax=Rhizobacter sp. OV335 TaxID=1500264 RepID=UPI00090ED196|nr:DUF378 domain-containing protein [Rhizobacter sp. OV335]SHM49988.1 protein of unknown function [Rhizobacter sp. OV335]
MPYINPLSSDEPPTEEPVTVLDWTAFVLLLAGGLNLGLYAVFGIDGVVAAMGDNALALRLFYGLVGCSAIYGMVRTMRTGRPL